MWSWVRGHICPRNRDLVETPGDETSCVKSRGQFTGLTSLVRHSKVPNLLLLVLCPVDGPTPTVSPVPCSVGSFGPRGRLRNRWVIDPRVETRDENETTTESPSRRGPCKDLIGPKKVHFSCLGDEFDQVVFSVPFRK